jgi:hypothetical protein
VNAVEVDRDHVVLRWSRTSRRQQRVNGDHFELPSDPVELLRHVRPADQQWFIEDVTAALAVAAETKDFRRCRMCSKPGP